MRVTRLALSLPGGEVEIARPGRVCGIAVDRFQGATSWAGSYRSHEPWSARIEPPRGVRAGRWASFRVRIANESRLSELAVPCYHDYLIRLAGAGREAVQSRVLSCPRAERIVVPTGGSGVVAARVYVPWRFAGKQVRMWWRFEREVFSATFSVAA